jgi:hypothetical protein
VIGKRWEVGLGFGYRKQKASILSQLYFPTQGAQWLGVEATETNVRLITFDAYTIRYWRLFSRLYFTPKLIFSIGGAKETQETNMATDSYITLTDIY